jgi:hypothetical protein
MLPENTAQAELITIDVRVLLFTTLVAVIAGVLFGMAPGLQAARTDVNETLKEGGRSRSMGVAHHRVRSALVVVETTLALILMVGTGLMLKSFLRVTRADPGFDPNHVLTANVSAPESKYKEPAHRAGGEPGAGHPRSPSGRFRAAAAGRMAVGIHDRRQA